ncbi:amidohydrolase family protein [Roseomonas sp. OT10]|uniref:amidohydrolase family protein n=1 Tax=Roseomonas cutis TaxID=2897332 RepID=UPI001E3BC2BC|nr:amidohydrolase family protein [Roseomonas sp. OT10]UFN46944.1 amidohydrolase family protein [Roseomonas sp. OT10]
MTAPGPHPSLPWGRLEGPTLLTARWVLGHEAGRHLLLREGELVFEDGAVTFAGHGYAGPVARRVDYGAALIAPGFVDLDALSDLDTTILGFDNQPAWRKGRVWPRSYVEAGPFEMYSPQELAFQKRYAFAHLLRNGITTALPIASLFYREWGETVEEFTAAAEAAEALNLRVWLGPAYRSGGQVVEADGRIVADFDAPRGLRGLEEAIAFCRANEGRAGGLVRTMLAPDRVETCTPDLLRRTAAAAADLGVPWRQHALQSAQEVAIVRDLHGTTPAEWLASLGVLSPRLIVPHATVVSGRDLALLRDGGVTIAHCPLVTARGGAAIDSFARYRAMGLNLGLGTDTWPADMLLNMQIGLLLCRVREGRADACRAEDLFDAATLGGARALGRDDLGRLAPGARADIVVWDLAASHLGQVIDPVQTLLLSGRGTDARTVIVDGRASMQEGEIPGVDWAAWGVQAQAQFDRLVSLYPRRTFGHPPAEAIFSSAYPVRRAAKEPT